MNLQFLADPDLPDLPEKGRVLGGAHLGWPRHASTSTWPVQTVDAPLLGCARDRHREIWLCDGPCHAGNSEGIRWQRAGDLLYGVLELDEADFTGTDDSPALQLASQEAYRRIFRLLEREQLPHLLRVWNYLAAINQESNGLERYRQFNIGRQDAFLEFQRGATGNVPAACAIGIASGPLNIAFLAGKGAPIALENPRQVSAYHYPATYGPRSPTFSRAALVYLPGQEILFISGTASIVGHQTIHPDDVVGQCRETMANVAAVLDAANRLARGDPYRLDALSYRVYLRSAGDYSVVRATLAALLGDTKNLVFLQADICRQDLLLEIEAMASHAVEIG